MYVAVAVYQRSMNEMRLIIYYSLLPLLLLLLLYGGECAIGLQPLEQYLIVSSQRGPAALVAGLGRESALQRAAATALVYFESSVGRQCLADSSGCGTLHICIHTYISETSGAHVHT